MSWERKNRSNELPVSDDAISGHLRVDGPELLSIAKRHVQAATFDIEYFAEIAVLNQEIRASFNYPAPIMDNVTLGRGWRLPVGPFSGEVAPTVSLLGIDGTIQQVDAVSVTLTHGARPLLFLQNDIDLPSLVRQCKARLVIEYQAGYGPDHTAVPADLAHAILDQASLYLDVGHDLRRGHSGLSPHTARIAARYRGVKIG